jgi:ankyrin repeat protein
MRATCLKRNTLFVLHDLDQCSRDSRSRFLDYIERLSSRSERAFKVMITSRNPQALHGEIRGALTLDIDGLVSATYDDGQLGGTSQPLTRLCPSSTHKSRLEELLAKLTPIDEWTATKLRFAQHHTEWPANPSLESLDQFTRCVESISPDEAPETQLDKMLRVSSGYEEFRWMLGWIICGYRPLSLDELCDLLRSRRGETDWPASPSSKRALRAGYRQQLEAWLRVLTEFKNDKVFLRREIRNILDRDGETESFVWTEVKRTAHRTIVDFCLAYLASAEAQSSLEFLFSQLLARAEQQPGDQKSGPQQLTGSIVPDGARILFYLVQALPYHLSRCSPVDRARAVERLVAGPADNPYTPWAKVYWAMSNPFSRTPRPPGHPLPTLVGLDMVSYESVKRAGRMLRQQCILAAAGSRSNATFVAEYLRDAPEPTTIPFLLDVLFGAIQAHNEQLAVEVVLGIASQSKRNNLAIKWPESIIRAAVWLDMDRLATAVLSRGASPDPQDGPTTTPFPFPLYLASCLGHESMVRVLADYGAKLDRLRDGVFGILQAAASRGHSGVLKQLVAKDRSLLESRQPYSGLYYAASYGHWKAIETLLELGADPEPAQGARKVDTRQSFWNPLAIACRWSYPRVTETLLRKGADPNSLGPRGVDTPLWFAAVNDPSVDCVTALLEHGADPNHARLSPPLLLELAGSPADEDAVVAVCEALLTGDQPVNIQATGPGGITALMMAASRGRLTLVRWLLNNGADVNALDDQKESALHYAVSGEKVEVVKELLERKARINTVGGPPVLHKALDQPAIVKLLLDAGANPDVEDDSGHTLINRAVVASREDVIEMLIAKKANLDHPDSAGWSPIFDAVAYVKSASITRLLVDNGADLTKAVDRGIRGGTLLHYAVLGPLEIMKILLEFTKYLELDRPDAKGQTALLFGSCYKWATSDCLKLLVLAGADVNAKNQHGERPLHNTIASDQTSLLSLLLDQPEIEVNCAADWYTPLQLACRRRNMQAVYALLDHGAHVNQVVPRCLNSTALVAALRPMDARRDQDSEEIDRLVRELVSRGADVKQAVKGNVVYTALSAACLGAGTGTINFLLDEGASADLADPISGRLPLHFAAMNGIENFRAILLAYRGDIMRPDSGGKTCLHWAAQFGNAETVSFILSKADDDATRKLYVSALDEHQWTPLCWAVRGLKSFWAEGMVSETPNHAAVVRTLLENGADPLIKCPLGNGDTTESLTLLELARRSGASDELISELSTLARQLDKLRPDGANRSAHADGALVHRYTRADESCDVCLSVGSTPQLSSVCPLTYDSLSRIFSATATNAPRVPTTWSVPRVFPPSPSITTPRPGMTTCRIPLSASQERSTKVCRPSKTE